MLNCKTPPKEPEAAERRQRIAHGASRGSPAQNNKSPVRAKENRLPTGAIFLPPLRGLYLLTGLTHGSSRGLPSRATPWLQWPGRAERAARPISRVTHRNRRID